MRTDGKGVLPFFSYRRWFRRKGFIILEPKTLSEFNHHFENPQLGSRQPWWTSRRRHVKRSKHKHGKRKKKKTRFSFMQIHRRGERSLPAIVSKSMKDGVVEEIRGKQNGWKRIPSYKENEELGSSGSARVWKGKVKRKKRKANFLKLSSAPISVNDASCGIKGSLIAPNSNRHLAAYSESILAASVKKGQSWPVSAQFKEASFWLLTTFWNPWSYQN